MSQVPDEDAITRDSHIRTRPDWLAGIEYLLTKAREFRQHDCPLKLKEKLEHIRNRIDYELADLAERERTKAEQYERRSGADRRRGAV